MFNNCSYCVFNKNNFITSTRRRTEVIYRFCKSKRIEPPSDYFETCIKKCVLQLVLSLKDNLCFHAEYLLIIERLFNIPGLTELLLWTNGLAFVVTAASIFIPFYLLFSLSEVLIVKRFRGKDAQNVNG
jgi:hypothetical protein